MYSKEDFMEMIRDWQADTSPENDELIISDASIDEEGKYYALAHDDKCVYSLSDDGSGNIVINYLGSK